MLIKANMLFMANQGYTTATDFADYLVKNKNLSFRESYAISAKLVNYAEKNKKILSELNLEEIKKFYKDLDKSVLKVFDVKNSMNAKKSHGGTSVINVKSMIKKYKKGNLMKLITAFFLMIFILTSCGKKSEPKYQGQIDQVNIIS
jgi:argininosuccinate lyase